VRVAKFFFRTKALVKVCFYPKKTVQKGAVDKFLFFWRFLASKHGFYQLVDKTLFPNIRSPKPLQPSKHAGIWGMHNYA